MKPGSLQPTERAGSPAQVQYFRLQTETLQFLAMDIK